MRALLPPQRLTCLRAAPGAWNFTSNSTNHTFTFATFNYTYDAAESYCQMNGGGHLAAYGKLSEQKDAEQYYIGKGLLLPFFHRQYWIGLSSTTKTYPRFRWKDPKVPTLDAPGAYVNWGIMTPQNKKEPFALFPPELCGAANFTQMSMGVGGWSDSNCNNAFAFMCKIRSFDSYPDCEVTSGGVQVCFNARPATFDEAESVCASQCGHVVSYTTQAEQYEVENVYISNVRRWGASGACLLAWKQR
jgi:hypothetical protein